MTAFTFTETLSRVITSCGGTCSAVTRMSMMIIRSTNGTIHFSPAVFRPTKRPSRRTTPCSYSFTMRRPITTHATTITTGIRKPIAGMRSPYRAPVFLGYDVDDEPVHGDHADARPGRD